MLSERDICDIRDCIADHLHPEKIVLFGSYAEDRATDDSDIDLLVVMASDLNQLKRNVAVKRLFSNRSFSLDVFVFTPDEVAMYGEVKGSLIYKALQAGRVIYEQ